MLQKVIITLLVCAATVLTAVYSAPNQLKRDTSPPGYEDRPLVTNLPANSLTHTNDPERTVHNGDASHDTQQNEPTRTKRAIIFRPLFVYRQQEIKKQKLKAMREQQQQSVQQNQQQQQHTVASAACAACQHYQQSTSRKPVRYYAQQYPYQRW